MLKVNIKKERKMKKTIAIVLMALCTFALFAQGGSDAKSSTGDGLTHITMLYNATQTEAGPLPNDWVGYDILKNELGIELEASSLPSSSTDQDSKIQALAAADNLPDFFVANREVWLRLAQQGMLADVTDLYDDMPNRTALMFDADAIAFTTLDDGRSYGLGTPSIITRNEGLVIRKDWLDNLGLEVPTTTEELLEVLRAFTYDDPDGNGKNDTYGYGAFVEETTYEAYPGRRFEPLMGAFGVEGTWNLSKDNAGLQILKPEFYDFMVYLKKIIDEGLIDPNWMAYKKDDFRAAWKQGKFGVWREQNAALHAQNNYTPFDTNFPNGEIIVIDPPVGPTGKSSVGPAVRGLRIWCISAAAQEEGKAEKIAQMFEWMSHGEGYLLCGWGQEGINYVMGENGIPVSTDTELGFEKAKGQQYIQLRSMAFNYASDTELLSRYPVYKAPVSGKEMSALWTLRDMQSRKWTAANGADSMPVPSNDLKTYYQQGLAEFLAGKNELTPSNWAKFIEQLKNMGATEWEQKGIEYAKANSYLR